VSLEENPPPPTEARHKLGYVPELDGVSGIAILFVLGNHTPLGRFSSLLPGGFAGVDIFFVLSGFLITTLLVQEFDRTGSISLRQFYMRRALRLGPALVVMLIVFCLFSFAAYDKARARGNCMNALIALFYASNWVRVFSRNQLGHLAHTWSLSTEEQFYILWPIILLALLGFTRQRRYVVIVAAAIALLSWFVNIHLAREMVSTRRVFLHLCFGLDSRAETLMVGCILAVVWTSGVIRGKTKTRLQKCLVVLAPLSLACLVAFSVFSYLIGDVWFYFGFVVLAVLEAVLILEAMVSQRSWTKRLLRMKWLVWVGSVSYGLYLWHWPIFTAMNGFGFKGWVVVLMGLPLTFAFVLSSYYWMEKPILAWKKRFTPDGRREEVSSDEKESGRALAVG
jgi:peptidoglycan/LPS O-acetylase OafA/YrhL